VTDKVGFDWLAGTWRCTDEEGVCEEFWSEAGGDTQFGAFRWTAGGRTRFYELFVIERNEDGIWLRLRHFGPGMVPLEDEGPLAWRLAETGDKLAIFENPAQDFPRRVLYHRTAEAELLARIEGITEDGEERTHAFHFSRYGAGDKNHRFGE
jgi:hypothetical protein